MEQARSSARLERYLDTVEVWGSSPHGPTIYFNKLAAVYAASKAPNSSVRGLKLRPHAHDH
jgi:hypothetical protein